MHNPLSILPLLFRVHRPSRVMDMKAVSCPFWIKKGYEAMTFFGHIVTHSQDEANHFNDGFNALKNHEMIHLYQARSTHNSWLCFYWKYFVFWLKACRYRKYLKNAGYLLNPFEMEAYAHMYEKEYLQPGGQATGWKVYAAMSLQQRLDIYLTGRMANVKS